MAGAGPVEFLLESHEDWPDIFGGLLSECVLRKSGETPIQAFRRELTVGDPAGGGRRPPLLWTNDSDIAGWTGSNPLTVRLQIDPQALDEAIERWVAALAEIAGRQVRAAAALVEPDTFGPAASSLIVVSGLVAAGLPVSLVKYGEPIAAALGATARR